MWCLAVVHFTGDSCQRRLLIGYMRPGADQPALYAINRPFAVALLPHHFADERGGEADDDGGDEDDGLDGTAQW